MIFLKNDYSIGGEQSGHIIIRKYASTGDGILTAIMLAECMVEYKKTLSQLAEPVKMFPQTVKNVVVKDKTAVTSDQRILDAVEEVSETLGKTGRILLRESGTEPLIRVMVESNSQKTCDTYATKIIDLIISLGYSRQ